MAYYNGKRRRKPAGATTRGGWGHRHQQTRARLAPVVAAGKATCARCGEPIHPDDDWHLDHTDDRTSYAGISHAYCNLADGANKTNGKRPPPPFVQHPYKWSQRWFEDPPVGTINLDGGRNPEIYLGNGNWHAIDVDTLEAE